MLIGALVSGLLVDKAHAEEIIIPPYSGMTGKPLSTVECLAVNAYHEARSESDIANTLVMGVVLNRVKDKRFPNSVCEVVFQKKAFSWTGDGVPDTIKDKKQYTRLYRLAESVLINKEFTLSITGGAEHYHATYVEPYWINSDKMVYITTIDNHKFYRWRK